MNVSEHVAAPVFGTKELMHAFILEWPMVGEV